MTPEELHRALLAQGAHFVVELGVVTVAAPRGALTAKDRAALNELRGELRDLVLSQSVAVARPELFPPDRCALPLASDAGHVGKLAAYAQSLDGVTLFDLATAPACPQKNAEVFKAEVHRRARLLVEESAGRRPPPNPGVRAMLERGHGRFGFRAQAERSLTVWLRRNRPQVAELWPEALVDAAWIDWRGHVGPEAVPALDEAFRIVNRVDFGQHMSPRPAAVVGPASSPVELAGQSAAERRQP